MATDQDVTARIDRIVIQVQNGATIHDALTKENLFRWYYREIAPHLRAPVDRARKEYLETHLRTRPDTSGFTVMVECHMPHERHTRFKAECQNRGTTMNRTINSLVNDWLNSPVGGVGSGVGSKV